MHEPPQNEVALCLVPNCSEHEVCVDLFESTMRDLKVSVRQDIINRPDEIGMK